MKKLLLLFSFFVLLASCKDFPSDNEICGYGIVCRTARVYVGSLSHIVMYLDNRKILRASDAFDPNKGQVKKTSLAQVNDTVFYNAKGEILDIRFRR